MEGLDLVEFSITYGVHAFIRADKLYNYILVIHEDVQKYLNVQKLTEIFIVDEDVNPVPNVSIEVKKFTGKETVPVFQFLNMSSVYGCKSIMIPRTAYVDIKMRL